MLETVRKNVSEAAAKNIERWLNEPKYSEYKTELEHLIRSEKWTELEDAFYSQLEFGTAGIRGVTGLGSARVSRVTISEATQALCAYTKQLDPLATKKGIVIAYDTRLTSHEFSKLAAEVCAGNGVKAYLFDGYRSTPELSFAVRHLHAAAGIVISASHNPPADNGFKAYLSDGGQIAPPHDTAVMKLVKETTKIDRMPLEESINNGAVRMIGEEIDAQYIAAVSKQSVGTARDLSIVYSPLHGAGQRNTLPVLESNGFIVTTVQSQMIPDGNFPSVENNKPNPEEKAANDLAVAQMMAEQCDIAITNDPDADRIGVIARQGEEPKYLSGNQIAALAADYVLSCMEPVSDPYIAKTIVTTDLLDAIAKKHDVRVYGDMLIGFRYIGELILTRQDSAETFVLGAEESYGMLRGDYARDKDGAVGALLLAECAADLKANGQTLYDRLLELYAEYGLYVERLDTVVCPGAKGFEQMQRIMQHLRTQPPKRIINRQITSVVDYSTLVRTFADGTTEQVTCNTTGNVIVLEFGEHSRRITIRPSGTEPKLKLYVQWHQAVSQGNTDSIEAQYEQLQDELEGLARELEGMLLEV